jgi:hypothetical protein
VFVLLPMSKSAHNPYGCGHYKYTKVSLVFNDELCCLVVAEYLYECTANEQIKGKMITA